MAARDDLPPVSAPPVRPWLAPGIAPAAVTGVVIAAYTLVDGVGVRLSGNALGYTGWLFLVQGWLVIAATRLAYGRGFTVAMRRSAPAGPGRTGGKGAPPRTFDPGGRVVRPWPAAGGRRHGAREHPPATEEPPARTAR